MHVCDGPVHVGMTLHNGITHQVGTYNDAGSVSAEGHAAVYIHLNTACVCGHSRIRMSLLNIPLWIFSVKNMLFFVKVKKLSVAVVLKKRHVSFPLNYS